MRRTPHGASSLLLALSLAACSQGGATPRQDAGRVSNTGDDAASAPSDAAPPGDGGASNTVDDAASLLDGGASNTSGDVGTDGSSGSADGSCPTQVQPDDPAQEVTFVLTNTSSSDRYVIDEGQSCEAFLVDDYDLVGHPDPFCEGVDAGASATFTRVPAGGSFTFRWDGLHAVPYTTFFTCSASSAPGPCRPYTVTSRKATPAGAHTAMFQIANGPPSCDAGFERCTATWGAGLCEPDAGTDFQTITATFDLPASAGQTVDVPIP